MKKWLSAVLIIITLITVVSLCTACYSPKNGGLLFTEVEGGYQVTGVSLKDRFYKNFTVDIPSHYNGKPVVAISDGAFMGYTSLISVNIPNTVKTIGDNAFAGCIFLESVDIPDSVTYIGDGAFCDCIGLTNISIPDSITHFGDFAFDNCSSLNYNIFENCKYLGNRGNPYLLLFEAESDNITSCKIHPDTKIIFRAAFAECTSLTSVTIPDGVTTIEWNVFHSCTNLTSVTIPDSVTTIGSGTFANCPSLTYNIYDNAKYLGNDTNPYVALIDATSKEITSYNIHSDTKVISERAFFGCTSLTSVTIPESVTTIGLQTFSGCTSLTNVTIPDSVTTIGWCAFENCHSLTSVTISDSVTTIDYGAFDDCRHLQNVYYYGNQTEWNKMEIGAANDYFIGANITFNSNNP